jgi:hypothetical protein
MEAQATVGAHRGSPTNTTSATGETVMAALEELVSLGLLQPFLRKRRVSACSVNHVVVQNSNFLVLQLKVVAEIGIQVFLSTSTASSGTHTHTVVTFLSAQQMDTHHA